MNIMRRRTQKEDVAFEDVGLRGRTLPKSIPQARAADRFLPYMITVQLDRLHVMHKTEFAKAHHATPPDRSPAPPPICSPPRQTCARCQPTLPRAARHLTPLPLFPPPPPPADKL